MTRAGRNTQETSTNDNGVLYSISFCPCLNCGRASYYKDILLWVIQLVYQSIILRKENIHLSVTVLPAAWAETKNASLREAEWRHIITRPAQHKGQVWFGMALYTPQLLARHREAGSMKQKKKTFSPATSTLILTRKITKSHSATMQGGAKDKAPPNWA